MKQFIFLSILNIFIQYQCSQVHGQYENIWAFGQNAGINFNSGLPLPIKTSMDGSRRLSEANASVCDSQGRLLFYTNGLHVWNSNHDLMPNGDDLAPFDISSCSQGTIIIPSPGDNSKYFIFSLSPYEALEEAGKLYYSIVDINLNNGLGDVLQGKKGILIDSNLTEKMTAVVGNHCNIWLLTCTQAAKFKAYEINSLGVNRVPVISEVGLGGSGQKIFGNVTISSDGRKVAATMHDILKDKSDAGAVLYDFNLSTGRVIDPIQLLFDPSYGVCFSQDGKKLYVNTSDDLNANRNDPFYQPKYEIYQFDLSSNDSTVIKSSKTSIGVVRGLGLTHLKLAPNGKIYLNTDTTFTDRSLGMKALGVINSPNLSGVACDYIPNAVQLLLGTFTALGLPNVVVGPVRVQDTVQKSNSVKSQCWQSDYNLEITSGSNWDFLWNDGDTNSEKTINSPGGTYWVSYYSSPCNFNIDTFHVVLPSGSLPKLLISPTCKNDNNGFIIAKAQPGDSTIYHYQWRSSLDTTTLSTTDSLTNIPAGHYSVRITTPSGCDTTLFFHIPEEDYQVSFEADTIICEGDTLQFNNTSDPHFQSFSWDFGDGRQSGLKHPTNSYANAGSYDITLIGRGEVCTGTAYRRIVVDPQLPLSFYVEPDSICAGEAVYFYPRTDGSTLGLHWQFGDGTEMGGPNERMVRHAYEHDGFMTVIMRGRYRACPGQEYRDSVYVYPLPEIDLGADDPLCLNGRPIVLENLRRAPAGRLKYLWSTGDTSARIKVVCPGVYSLKVSAPPLGCTSTESVEVKKDCYIDIPNAFTPNGDGENDYFFPRQLLSGSVIAFRMQVFNRWGQVVFESTAADGRGWDGRFNGKEQPVGVYVYLVDVELANGKQERYEGNVTLLR